MNQGRPVNMADYSYELPHGMIAEHPAVQRDHSRLLIMNDDGISDDRFYNLHKHLPDGGLMVFNNTRVIRARLVFRKDTGARIEVFCLEPLEPSPEINTAFESTSAVVWKCLVGNARKWRSGRLTMDLGGDRGHLFAERTGDLDGAFAVRFSWDIHGKSFAEVIDEAGKVPLPPYIEREAEAEDVERYQTIYARHHGSVAAPTAGLHFTPEVFDSLKEKNIGFENVTLHVGAGTFRPVSHPDIRDHKMHTEQIVISQDFIRAILNNNGHLTAVGTTSLRTIESLYWFGVLLEGDENAAFSVSQWAPYKPMTPTISSEKALGNILHHMQGSGREVISGDTSLIIIPGYSFWIADILITNFHMPRSTLLLLVAAFAGEKWQDAYAYALENHFRFLSYGDSCLFFRQDQNV
ncbi:MAG: S-adenosylmethionine:tRNA ribosyltransferase-isomerase [Bacteroidales bacterium]|nr:S-adenosylmethionine:tRNA ribosyltransferase-isomerase [Bacteroidales bacterium]